MPFYRATMFWRQEDNGFSETYFRTASSIQAMVLPTEQLVGAILGMKNSRVEFLGCRISDNAIFRDAFFLAPGVGGLAKFGQFPAIGAAEADSAVLFRLEATTLHRRMLMFRGIPEIIVSATGDYAPDNGAWQIGLSAFAGFLEAPGGAFSQGGSWQLRTIDPSQPKQALLSITVNADPRYITVFTVAPLQKNTNPGGIPSLIPIAVGDRVLIRGVPQSIHVNAVWVVNSIQGSGEYLLGPHRSICQTSPRPVGTSFGSIAALNYVGVTIDNVLDLRLANRKCGRPFGEPRGRRLVR